MSVIAILGLLLALFVCCNHAIVPLSSAPSRAVNGNRKWRDQAILKLWTERNATGRTPLVPFEIKGMPFLDLRFKNESATPTGNSKHRVSWALFMWALTEGLINENTIVYDASSGNSAISEAYMAQIVNVPFNAVVPNTTEQAIIDNIKKWGGKVYTPSKIFEAAEKLAKATNGFYLNEYGNALFAEEFHAAPGSKFDSMNIMHECIMELFSKNITHPHFFVHSAGSGGTITSVARYIQKYALDTQVILADTQYSRYYDYVVNGNFSDVNNNASALWVKPGIPEAGLDYERPAILGKTTSLSPVAIDTAYKVPDLASVAAMHVLKENGIDGGPSTGLNFITSLAVASSSATGKTENDKLRIITVLCDSSALYNTTYLNETWIAENFEPHGGLPVFECWKKIIEKSMADGSDPIATGQSECNKDAGKNSQTTPSGHSSDATTQNSENGITDSKITIIPTEAVTDGTSSKTL